MATKIQLRDSFVAGGWDVQLLPWRKVSADHLATAKYDVDVVSPEGDFFTAQVVVADDGGPAEDAVAKGRWETRTPAFAEALRSYLRGEEVSRATVYAIAVKEVFEADEVAIAVVYSTSGGNVTAADHVVKRRSGAFDFKPIA